MSMARCCLQQLSPSIPCLHTYVATLLCDDDNHVLGHIWALYFEPIFDLHSRTSGTLELGNDERTLLHPWRQYIDIPYPTMHNGFEDTNLPPSAMVPIPPAGWVVLGGQAKGHSAYSPPQPQRLPPQNFAHQPKMNKHPRQTTLQCTPNHDDKTSRLRLAPFASMLLVSTGFRFLERRPLNFGGVQHRWTAASPRATIQQFETMKEQGAENDRRQKIVECSEISCV
jgi:hypothetical protein